MGLFLYPNVPDIPQRIEVNLGYGITPNKKYYEKRKEFLHELKIS